MAGDRIVLHHMRDNKWRWQVFKGVSDVPLHDDQFGFDTAKDACIDAVCWLEAHNG